MLRLEHCYRVQVKLWNDSDVLVWCKWAHCLDQKKPLKFFGKFMSNNWLPGDVVHRGLGEVRPPIRHCASRPLYPNGVGCARDTSIYSSGASIARLAHPLGLDDCCNPVYDLDCTILLETGDWMLQEDWSDISLEQCDLCAILLETGDLVLMQWGDPMQLEVCTTCVILTEDGDLVLQEGGSSIRLEVCDGE